MYSICDTRRIDFLTRLAVVEGQQAETEDKKKGGQHGYDIKPKTVVSLGLSALVATITSRFGV